MNQMTISLALFVVAALMAVPMLRYLRDQRVVIRTMAIASLVINVLWFIGALLVVGSSLIIALGLAQITLSLFVTAFTAVIALPLVATKRKLCGVAKISVYVTLSLTALAYLGGLGLIWVGEAFLLLVAGPLLLISLIFTTTLLSVKRKNARRR